jgi:signal transduction histidine kinase
MRKFFNLRVRYSLLFVGLILFMLEAGTGFAVWQLHKTTSEVFDSAANAVSDSFYNSAVVETRERAHFIANSLIKPLDTLDVREIGNVARTIRGESGVLEMIVFDRQGKILHDGTEAVALFNSEVRPELRSMLDQGKPVESGTSNDYRVAVPIMRGNRIRGGIEIGVSLAQVSANIDWLNATFMGIHERTHATLLTALALGTAVMAGFGALIGIVIAGGLIRPLRQISAFAQRVGQGDYDAPLAVNRSDELGQLARDLRHMAADLKGFAQHARLSMLGEMAVGVAHELNQPLNVIRMAAENAHAALEGRDPDIIYAQSKLNLLADEAGRMGDIIRRMCSLARTEDERVLIDPSACISDAVTLLRGQLDIDNIEVESRFDHGGRRVLAHPQQLTHAFINILANARDAIVDHRATSARNGFSPDSGKIEISSHLLPDRSAIEIRIVDNGGGIAEPMVKRIFDPFITTKEPNKGTGLGLSLSLSFINATGGGIAASNVPGGAALAVWLPLWQDTATSERDAV